MATTASNRHFDYAERIVVDSRILAGKPVLRGTRISVELVLAHLAENPDLHELFAAYPQLSIEDVKACLAYARALVGGEDVYIETRPWPASSECASFWTRTSTPDSVRISAWPGMTSYRRWS